MTRECHVRFCERLEVKLPRPTHLFSSRYTTIFGTLRRNILCDDRNMVTA